MAQIQEIVYMRDSSMNVLEAFMKEHIYRQDEREEKYENRKSWDTINTIF